MEQKLVSVGSGMEFATELLLISCLLLSLRQFDRILSVENAAVWWNPPSIPINTVLHLKKLNNAGYLKLVQRYSCNQFKKGSPVCCGTGRRNRAISRRDKSWRKNISALDGLQGSVRPD